MKQDNEPIPGQISLFDVAPDLEPKPQTRTCSTCSRWGKVYGWDFHACFNMDSPKWGHNSDTDLGGCDAWIEKGTEDD